MLRINRNFQIFLMIFVLVFFMSGCGGKAPSLTGEEEIEVTVGSEMPDFLTNIELDNILLEDLVVDYSNVNMDVVGDYVVTYALISDDDESILYEITVHVVDYPTTVEPIIFGVKNLIHVVGESRINLMDGVTAVDREYGDITHRVLITDYIDWGMPGSYDVRYQVENADGYTAVEIATVEVKFDDVNLTLPSEFIIVEQNGLFGLKTNTGEDLLAIEYEDISYFGEGILSLQKYDEVYYYNSTAKEFLQYEYLLVTPFVDGLAVVKSNSEYSFYEMEYEHYSYMNSAGELTMPFIYTNARPFIDGLAIVEMGDNVGVIDKSGQQVIEIKYEDVNRFMDKFFIKTIDTKYVVVDADDEFVIELSKDYAGEELNYDGSSVYIVQIDGMSSLLDEDCNVVLQTTFERINQLLPGIYFAYDIDGYGAVYNLENDTVLPHIFNVRFEGESLLIQSDDLWGIYDLELGVESVEPSYLSLDLLCGEYELFIAEDEEGMLGVITASGLVKFDFEASSITNDCESNMFKNGFYMYQDEDGYYGLLNQYGSKSTTNTYISIGDFADGWALVQDKSTFLYGYLTDDQIDNERYGYSTILFNAYGFVDGFASIQKLDQDQGWTALDSDGFDVTTTVFYYEVGAFNDGIARVRTSGLYEAAQYAYINEDGDEIISDLSYAAGFNDGYGVVRFTYDSHTWGMVDNEGTIIIPGLYDYVGLENDGMIPVRNSEGLYGYYNIDKELAVEIIYSHASAYSDGRAIVKKYNDYSVLEYLVIDKDGSLIFNSGKSIKSYSDGLALRKDDDGFVTFYNVDGELALETEWTFTTDFSAGLSVYLDPDSSLYGYFNKNGEVVIEAQYSSVHRFTNDSPYALVQDGSDEYSWGIIDKSGATVFETNYKILVYEDMYLLEDWIGRTFEYRITNGILSTDVEDRDGKIFTKVYQEGWTIYDGTTLIISDLYDFVDFHYFKDMFVTTVDEDSFGMINKSGEVILEPLYEEITYSYVYDTYIKVKLDGNYGIYSIAGEVIVPANYDSVHYDEVTNIFIVVNGDMLGIYAMDGQMILEAEYTSVQYIDTEIDYYSMLLS